MNEGCHGWYILKLEDHVSWNHEPDCEIPQPSGWGWGDLESCAPNQGENTLQGQVAAKALLTHFEAKGQRESKKDFFSSVSFCNPP